MSVCGSVLMMMMVVVVMIPTVDEEGVFGEQKQPF